MRLALRLARLGCGRTHPNPRVGAVAVRDGRVVACGAHLRCGGAHAEAQLLARTPPDRLRGATLYVSLEPCAHQGKTPACAPAIATAGFARVVAALEDPFPQVQGRGFACLRRAGIAVTAGVCAAAAARLNAPFLWYQESGLPLLSLKAAASADGRVAAVDRSSRWITGAPAREQVHRWRAAVDAILIGRGTWEADDPALSARPRRRPQAQLARWVPEAQGAGAFQPARIVVDSHARLGGPGPAVEQLAARAGGPWIVACGRAASRERIARLERHGVTVWQLPENHGGAGVDLAHLARRMAGEGLLDVLVESGPTLASALLRAGLVQRIRLFLAPSLLGGPHAWTGDLGVAGLDRADRLVAMRSRRVGRDLLIAAERPPLARCLAWHTARARAAGRPT